MKLSDTVERVILMCSRCDRVIYQGEAWQLIREGQHYFYHRECYELVMKEDESQRA